MHKGDTDEETPQALGGKLTNYVMPWLLVLGQLMDKSPVRTYARTLQAIVRFKHNRLKLMLMVSPAHTFLLSLFDTLR